jgi:hypothetical protein
MHFMAVCTSAMKTISMTNSAEASAGDHLHTSLAGPS